MGDFSVYREQGTGNGEQVEITKSPSHQVTKSGKNWSLVTVKLVTVNTGQVITVKLVTVNTGH